MTNRTISPISQIETRYSNLLQACQWVAALTRSEARLVLWSYKNHLNLNVGGKRVAQAGGAQHIISQAVRFRNL